MPNSSLLRAIIVTLLMTISVTVSAQIIDIEPGETLTLNSVGEIVTYEGIFADDNRAVTLIFADLSVDDTIYVLADGLGFVNTYLTLYDELDTSVIEDDNGGLGFDATVAYTVSQAGDYRLELTNIGSAGGFLLIVGVNTPEILNPSDDRSAAGRTREFAVEFDPFDCDDAPDEFRPFLSGRERTVERDDFVVHYTRSGIDEVEDDYLDELVLAVEASLDVQVNVLGWALPPSDCGEGGDERLDIYVLDIENFGASGIATPENLVGDNPNTPVEEYYATYSYLRIDNDMAFLEDEDDVIEYMRATVAHEIHHNIQFGYDSNDRLFGIYESGATWIETLVYPESSLTGTDVTPVFNTPDACFSSFQGRGSGDLRPYAEWVVIDSYTRDLGLDSYQFIWEYLAANEGLGAVYDAWEQLGSTPEEVILRAGIRNLLLDYAQAEFFLTTVRVENTVDDFGLVAPTRNGVQQLSVDYIELTDPNMYTLDLLNGENLELYVLGIDDDENIARLYPVGTSGTVDTTPYDFAFIIVLNTERHFDTDICVYTNWVLQLSDGSNAEILLQPTDEIWDATNFKRN